MADEPLTSVEDDIEAQLDGGRPKRKSKSAGPVYKVVGSAKIPVSKSMGKVWQSRRDIASAMLGDLPDVWREAMRYYDNDQMPHRKSGGQGSGNTIGNQRLNNNITETENVVFANVTTMVPALYARNPSVEITAWDEGNEEKATQVERLVNALFTKKATPGINLKSKAKRGVITTLLTNRSWMQIGWVFKEDSSEQALADLSKLAKDLEKAKSTKEIEAVEGKIQALEQTIDILRPAGPTARLKSPFQVLVDPAAEEIDATDAKWLMIEDLLPTQFLLAKYAKKKKGKVEHESIFEPTHVMKLGNDDDGSGIDDSKNFSLFSTDGKATQFGFSDDASFEKAKLTKVWFVWDKTTRRVFLFHDKDWSWPIWVWDDPLRLDTFFPVYPLTFFDSPSGPLTKGEVTYYLDQQDAINEIVDEERRARTWGRRNVFFDSNKISREDVEAVLSGNDGTARGINLPEGMVLKDVIFSMVPPSVQFKELFDKESKYRAIDRISSVGEVLRGAQFKTNTSKAAVNANVSASNMRIDEKSDQIEDWIGQIGWGIAQMCLQFYDKDDVAQIIGDKKAEGWESMTFEDIAKTFSARVVGGSSKKPTSAAKKEEALEVGQILGQFVNSAPVAVTRIMLEVFQEAFDEINMSAEDWKQLREEIVVQGQQKQQGPPGQQGQAPQQGNGQAQLTEQELKELLSKLPPEVKAQVVDQIKSGVPAQQALEQAIQQSQPPTQ